MQSERPLVISDTQVSGAGTSGGAPTFSLPALTQTFKCISVPCERATRCVPGQLLRLPLLRRLIRTAAWPGGGGGGAGSSSRNKALPLWAPRPSGPWEKPTLRGSGKHRKAGPELEGAPALLLPTGWQSVSTPGGLARPAWVSPRGRQQHPHLGACYQCRSSRPHPDLRLRKRRRRGLTPSGLTSPPGAPGAQAEGGRKGSGWRETPPLPGCELTQEKRTCTLRPQEGKQGCKLMLSTICLGEKAKEGMNLVEILPPANQKDKKSKPITTASLQASVLPMVSLSPAQGDCLLRPHTPGGNGHKHGTAAVPLKYNPGLLSRWGLRFLLQSLFSSKLAQDPWSSVARNITGGQKGPPGGGR
ncbi:nucleoplasmin-2 isoform X5 [Manis javanica]|uniref:nucleoplasmin-2 isoform X5 n=1 Tax=Manis javanica TaxID=9974 RepID=UPI003C6CDF18